MNYAAPWLTSLAMLLPQAALAQPCVGPIETLIGDAQESFSTDCCTTYDGSSGFHFCEWVDITEGTGWRCAERQGAPDDCDVEPTDTGRCEGAPMVDIDDARDAYGDACGQPWDANSGVHVCEWRATAWVCWGPGPASEDPPDPVEDPPDPVEDPPDPKEDPVDPSFCDEETIAAANPLSPPQPLDLSVDPSTYELTWRQLEPDTVGGWNVFQDVEYVTTVSDPTFQIPSDGESDRYYVESFDAAGANFSHLSLPVRAPAPSAFPIDAAPVDAFPDFLQQRRRGDLAGAWETIWQDEFTGTGAVDSTKWHFLDDPNHRDTAVQNTEHANRVNDVLVMDAIVNDDGKPEMSFIRTLNASNGIDTSELGDDFLLDPTQGAVYLETSVRLDEAKDIYHGWWAFWLFVNDIDDDGVTYRAYDDDAETGSEVDIFEYAPDAQQHGFNAAVFLAPTDESSIRPPDTNGGFAVPDALESLGIDLVDGRYHKLGLYYSPEIMRFYVDGVEFWTLTDQTFITGQARMGIHMTWEARDNSDGTGSFNPRSRYDECGDLRTFATGSLDDGAVYIDYVRVHRQLEPGPLSAISAPRAEGAPGASDAKLTGLGCNTVPASPYGLLALVAIAFRRRQNA